MATLLFAEVANGHLADITAKALTAARQLGGPVDVLIAGVGLSGAAQAAAALEGVARVRVAEDALYAHGLAEPLAALLVGLSADYDAIVAGSSAYTKNVLPRVAALLDVMQVSDITKVVSADTFERPIYAGNAIQTVQSTDPKRSITVRTASFAATGAGGPAPIEPVGAAADPGLSAFVGEALAKSDRPELTSAKIIISGGRAMQKAENFKTYIEPVADKLGAAMGASRAAVDAGYRAQRLAGRPDRQGRRARPLYRGRHLGRDPASGRHEGFQGHRRDQQGRGGADLPGRRLRPRRRPVHRAAGTGDGTGQNRTIGLCCSASIGYGCDSGPVDGGVHRMRRVGREAPPDEKMTFVINKVGVIGAGQMGNGIAQVCAQAGMDVVLSDVAEERLRAGLATINGLLARQVAKGQMDEADRAATLGRIATGSGPEQLADCDLVIEAASESEEVKRRIFAGLRPYLKPEAIVASNTSSISITRLASVTERPERFIGIHFMNPVPRCSSSSSSAASRPRTTPSNRPRPSSPGSARRRRCRRTFPPSSSTASCCR